MAFRARPAAEPEETSALKPEAWAELAGRENGIMETRRSKVRSVAFPHGTWHIVLDTHSDGESSTTRMHVRFRSSSPMRLRIQRHNGFTRLATRFGLADVKVPNPEVDRAFLIRTDNESVAQSLSLDRRFANALRDLPRGYLQVVPVRKGLRFVPGAGELRWLTSGMRKDLDTLLPALLLMRASVDGLTRLGVMREPLRPRA